MMKYTNKHGFPDIVVQWLLNDEYDYHPNTLSATSLMNPIRSIILRERYDDVMVRDVEDLIAMRYGTAIHASFEQVPYDAFKIKQEKRVFFNVTKDFKISGKYDMLERVGDSETFHLKDIKSTSVWSYVYGSKDEEYKKQLSIYKYILEKNGIKTIGTADIIMMFTDWKRADARKGGDYPKTRIKVKTVELFTLEDTEKYILNRLETILFSRELKDDELPYCTDNELWKDADKYVMMREGNQNASPGTYDTEEDCQKVVDDNNNDPKKSKKMARVVKRPGYVKRCPDYCVCHPYCNQFKELKENGFIRPDDEEE